MKTRWWRLFFLALSLSLVLSLCFSEVSFETYRTAASLPACICSRITWSVCTGRPVERPQRGGASLSMKLISSPRLLNRKKQLRQRENSDRGTKSIGRMNYLSAFLKQEEREGSKTARFPRYSLAAGHHSYFFFSIQKEKRRDRGRAFSLNFTGVAWSRLTGRGTDSKASLQVRLFISFSSFRSRLFFREETTERDLEKRIARRLRNARGLDVKNNDCMQVQR